MYDNIVYILYKVPDNDVYEMMILTTQQYRTRVPLGPSSRHTLGNQEPMYKNGSTKRGRKGEVAGQKGLSAPDVAGRSGGTLVG